jgi:hypothetical protein
VTEAIAPPPDQQPDQERPPLALDLDQLEAGDIEDMEEYCGQPIMPLLRKMFESIDERANLFDALSVLPAKVLTAMLGVAKRHQDPSFGMDQWRTIKLAEFSGPKQPTPPEPASPTPIHGQRGRSKSSKPSA